VELTLWVGCILVDPKLVDEALFRLFGVSSAQVLYYSDCSEQSSSCAAQRREKELSSA
jgi:hypothetical protein